MASLYHIVPVNQRGNQLYPLNDLDTIYPDIYEEEMKKYQNRVWVLNETIPILNCRWNDVIHLTAVHPKDIEKAFNSMGQKLISRRFYCFKASDFDPTKTIIYLYNDAKDNGANFTAYNPAELAKFSHLPKETLEYYKEEFEHGRRPFLFHKVAHILYKGTLDTQSAEIIDLDEVNE